MILMCSSLQAALPLFQPWKIISTPKNTSTSKERTWIITTANTKDCQCGRTKAKLSSLTPLFPIMGKDWSKFYYKHMIFLNFFLKSVKQLSLVIFEESLTAPRIWGKSRMPVTFQTHKWGPCNSSALCLTALSAVSRLPFTYLVWAADRRGLNQLPLCDVAPDHVRPASSLTEVF